MDHRWGVRKKIALDLAIFDRGVKIGQCKSGNVSRGGVFADIVLLDCSKNTSLEVEVVMDHLESVVRFRLHTVVVHSSAGGLGLMFSKMRAGVSQAMMDVLLAGQGALAWEPSLSYAALSSPERLEPIPRRVDSLLMR